MTSDQPSPEEEPSEHLFREDQEDMGGKDVSPPHPYPRSHGKKHPHHKHKNENKHKDEQEHKHNGNEHKHEHDHPHHDHRHEHDHHHGKRHNHPPSPRHKPKHYHNDEDKDDNEGDNMVIYYVQLVVVGATGLAELDFGPDPTDATYCVAEVGNLTDETSVVEDSLDPEWNHRMQFFFPTEHNEDPPDTLILKVFDKDAITREAVAGMVTLPLEKSFWEGSSGPKTSMKQKRHRWCFDGGLTLRRKGAEDGEGATCPSGATIRFRLRCGVIRPMETLERMEEVERRLAERERTVRDQRRELLETAARTESNLADTEFHLKSQLAEKDAALTKALERIASQTNAAEEAEAQRLELERRLKKQSKEHQRVVAETRRLMDQRCVALKEGSQRDLTKKLEEQDRKAKQELQKLETEHQTAEEELKTKVEAHERNAIKLQQELNDTKASLKKKNRELEAKLKEANEELEKYNNSVLGKIAPACCGAFY